MKTRVSRSVLVGLVFVALWRTWESSAAACAVCFGDPQSPMAKGAVMGVLTLGAIIGSVLVFIAGTGVYWLHRGARLARGAKGEGNTP